MTVITWFILPIVCAIAVAIYLYKKVKTVVSYFAVNWSLADYGWDCFYH